MMNIKLELLRNHIADILRSQIENIEIDADRIADSAAISALSEIRDIIAGDSDDFEAVERIVCVFEKYNIDCGDRHDF